MPGNERKRSPPELSVENMDTNDEYVSSVTLMILGEGLEPDEVSRYHDMEPSRA